MCAGHSLHKADWLKIALGLAAAGTGAGALGYGPLAALAGGAEGAAGAVAGDAYLPGLLAGDGGTGALTTGLGGAATDWASAEGGAGYPGWVSAEGGAGYAPESLASGGSTIQPGILAQLKAMGPNAKKLGKAAYGLKSMGLLNQQHSTPLAAPPPGGGSQTPGALGSAQIAFPDAYQPAPPYFPLDEILRKRMREGY